MKRSALRLVLRPVRTGEAMSDAEIGASLRERLGPKRRAVVGEQAPDPHPERSVVRHGSAQEAHSVSLGLVGVTCPGHFEPLMT